MKITESIRQVRKRAIITIAITSIVLSAITGGVVYLMGKNEIEKEVSMVAEREAIYVGEQLVKKGPTTKNLQQHANEIVNTAYTKFSFVSFVMPDGNLVAYAFRPNEKQLHDYLQNTPTGFSLGRPVAGTQQLHMNDSTYVQVTIPVSFGEQQRFVYLDALYYIEPKYLNTISERSMNLVPLAMLCVIMTAFLLYPIMNIMNEGLVSANKKMLHGNIASLEALGEAIAKRDSDTAEHNYRVTIYALELGKIAQIGQGLLRDLLIGSFLHDVGKIGIPDEILLKPGVLDEEERKIMMTHVTLGLDILSRSEWLKSGESVVGCHHEKWDGTGYPKGLRGRQIPVIGRIFAIADVFDALASERPYKKSIEVSEALEQLKNGSGTHFDPRLLEMFVPVAKKLHPQLHSKTSETLRKELRKTVETLFD